MQMPPESPFDPGWDRIAQQKELQEGSVAPRVEIRSDAGCRRELAALYAMSPGIVFLFIVALDALLRR
jgi:hypothetical protein